MIDWHDLLSQYGPMVYRTAYRLLGRAADAEECVQETFLSAVELARQEKIRSWPGLLRRLATARALDRLRAQSHRHETMQDCVELDGLPAEQAGPQERAEASELTSRLRKALVELPERQAQVFVLRFIEQMTYRQIAKELGLKRNAVGVLLHEARERLRTLLAEGGRR